MNLEATTSARRYPAAASHRARELRDAGFSLRDVGRIIGREFGATPSDSTILSWTVAGHSRRAYKRKAAHRAKTYSGRRPAAHHTPAARYARLVVLRAAGLSQRATSIVLTVDYGSPITEGQVRHAEVTGLYPAGRSGRRKADA